MSEGELARDPLDDPPTHPPVNPGSTVEDVGHPPPPLPILSTSFYALSHASTPVNLYPETWTPRELERTEENACRYSFTSTSKDGVADSSSVSYVGHGAPVEVVASSCVLSTALPLSTTAKVDDGSRTEVKQEIDDPPLQSVSTVGPTSTSSSRPLISLSRLLKSSTLLRKKEEEVDCEAAVPMESHPPVEKTSPSHGKDTMMERWTEEKSFSATPEEAHPIKHVFSTLPSRFSVSSSWSSPSGVVENPIHTTPLKPSASPPLTRFISLPFKRPPLSSAPPSSSGASWKIMPKPGNSTPTGDLRAATLHRKCMEWWWDQWKTLDHSEFFVSQPLFQEVPKVENPMPNRTLAMDRNGEHHGTGARHSVRDGTSTMAAPSFAHRTPTEISLFSAALFYARMTRAFSIWRHQQEKTYFRVSTLQKTTSKGRLETEEEMEEHKTQVEAIYVESLRIQRLMSQSIFLYILSQWTSREGTLRHATARNSISSHGDCLPTSEDNTVVERHSYKGTTFSREAHAMPSHVPFGNGLPAFSAPSSSSSSAPVTPSMHRLVTKEQIAGMCECIKWLFPLGVEEEDSQKRGAAAAVEKSQGKEEERYHRVPFSPVCRVLAVMLQLYLVDRLWQQAQLLDGAVDGEECYSSPNGNGKCEDGHPPSPSTGRRRYGHTTSGTGMFSSMSVTGRGVEHGSLPPSSNAPPSLSPFLLPVMEHYAPHYYRTIAQPVCVAYLYEEVFHGGTHWRGATGWEEEGDVRVKQHTHGTKREGEMGTEETWMRRRGRGRGRGHGRPPSVPLMASSSGTGSITSFQSLRNDMELLVMNAIRFNAPSSSIAHQAQRWKLSASKWCRDAASVYDILLQLMEERQRQEGKTVPPAGGRRLRRGGREAYGGVGEEAQASSFRSCTSSSPPELWHLVASLWGYVERTAVPTTAVPPPMGCGDPMKEEKESEPYLPSRAFEVARMSTTTKNTVWSPPVQQWIRVSPLLASNKDDSSLLAACRHPISLSQLFQHAGFLHLNPSSNTPLRSGSSLSSLRFTSSAVHHSRGEDTTSVLTTTGVPAEGPQNVRDEEHAVDLLQRLHERLEEVQQALDAESAEDGRKGRTNELGYTSEDDHILENPDSGDDKEEEYLKACGNPDEEVEVFWLLCDLCQCWRILSKEIRPIPLHWTCAEDGRRCSRRGIHKQIRKYEKLKKKEEKQQHRHPGRNNIEGKERDGGERKKRGRKKRGEGRDLMDLLEDEMQASQEHREAIEVQGGSRVDTSLLSQEGVAPISSSPARRRGRPPKKDRPASPPPVEDKRNTGEQDASTATKVVKRGLTRRRHRNEKREPKRLRRDAEASSTSRSSSSSNRNSTDSSLSSSSSTSQARRQSKNGAGRKRQRKEKRKHSKKRGTSSKNSATQRGSEKRHLVKRGRKGRRHDTQRRRSSRRSSEEDSSSERRQRSTSTTSSTSSSSSSTSSSSSASSSSSREALEDKIKNWERQVRDLDATVHPPSLEDLHGASTTTSISEIIQCMQKAIKDMDRLDSEMERTIMSFKKKKKL